MHAITVADIHPFVARTIEFPADVEAVLHTVGDVRILAPDESASVTIATLLKPLEEHTFTSARGLTESITGQLPEVYIGRKHYDDRSPNIDVSIPSARMTSPKSF